MIEEYDLKSFLNEVFKINVYDFQEDFIYDCLNKQRVIGVFCRQTGKSLSISMVAILEALKSPNQNILIIAPTDLQAGTLFEKIIIHLQNSLLAVEVESITKRYALFKNGSKISAHTTGDSGDNIRGLTGKVIILEEAAFIKDSIVQEVIIPMGAATNAKIIKISTPFGMNHFYESAFKDKWELHQVSYQRALDCGHFKQEFIDEQKESLTDMQFRTEYGAEFIADQDAYFKRDLLQSVILEYPMIEVSY